MIRTVEYDPQTGEIFAGGWVNFGGLQKDIGGGSGLWVSKDGGASFHPHEHFDSLVNARGDPGNINTIKIVYHKGHRLLFVGGEGKGPTTDRKPTTDVPSFWVSVDGGPFAWRQANFEGLGSALGADIVTPQRGIVVTDTDVYVCSYGTKIAVAELDRFINGNVPQWFAITDNTARSGLTVTNKINGQWIITTAGQDWGVTAPTPAFVGAKATVLPANYARALQEMKR